MIEYAMWAVAAVSLAGTVANLHKRRWGFACWMGTNAAWVLYDLHKTAYPQAALMATYFGLAVWGWFKWGAKGAREAHVIKAVSARFSKSDDVVGVYADIEETYCFDFCVVLKGVSYDLDTVQRALAIEYDLMGEFPDVYLDCAYIFEGEMDPEEAL